MHMSCAHPWCRQTYDVTEDDIAFYTKISPTIGGKTYVIPPPRHCPDCRQQQRWQFQNQRFLYRRPSVSGKTVISAYAPDSPFPVIERSQWSSIDNTLHGRPYDFSRPFFDQFADLFRSTTKASVLQTGEMINAEYTHFVGWQKNCYLIFDAGNCEDCYYGTFMGYDKNCVDTLDMQRNELCYDCVDLNDCYGLFHATFCRSCASSAYLFDCIGCRHCLRCANLRNREYCIENRQVTPDEFRAAWRAVFDGSWDTAERAQQQWHSFLVSVPHRALHHTNAPHCVGDYLIHCDHVGQCYKCVELRDAQYCQYVVLQSSDLHDISGFGESLSYSYQLSSSGGLVGKVGMQQCAFGAYLYYGGSNLYYSIHCLDNCQHLFGCCDLNARRYCVLNVQYSEEEYERLVPRIIEHMQSMGEWGNFFPVTLSPFAYNESVAQDHFPLTKEAALERGFRWRDPDQREYRPSSFVLPDSIHALQDQHAEDVLACVSCQKNYRLTHQEIIFYKDHGIAAPRHCPHCRYEQRLLRRNPQRLWQRACAQCGQPLMTSYSPDRPERVFCESCYTRDVYA